MNIIEKFDVLLNNILYKNIDFGYTTLVCDIYTKKLQKFIKYQRLVWPKYVYNIQLIKSY